MSQTREPPILRRRKNHLPEDIVLNILTRLPPKSVIRFRCVCKSWGSSITTPYFISAHLSGALHWISLVLEEEHKGEVIMSFDVNSEKFRMLVMPDGSLSISRTQRSLALFKGKLAFITFGISEQHGYHYSMWVMREYGVLESWNQLFVVPLARVSACIGFTMYGSLLLCSQLNNQADKFFLVDTKTLHEKDTDIQSLSCVATFMESLALLDGANMVSY